MIVGEVGKAAAARTRVALDTPALMGNVNGVAASWGKPAPATEIAAFQGRIFRAVASAESVPSACGMARAARLPETVAMASNVLTGIAENVPGKAAIAKPTATAAPAYARTTSALRATPGRPPVSSAMTAVAGPARRANVLPARPKGPPAVVPVVPAPAVTTEPTCIALRGLAPPATSSTTPVAGVVVAVGTCFAWTVGAVSAGSPGMRVAATMRVVRAIDVSIVSALPVWMKGGSAAVIMTAAGPPVC